MALAVVALAATAGVRASDAAPASGGGGLRLQADPPRLVLGRDAGADLRIFAPADVEDVALTASAGRVEALRRLPGGGFVARYRPPPERIPQVAIVSAIGRGARGTLDGWVAVPLSGQGDAKVRAQPGAPIALRIGDETFGPRPAGADGVAIIPVIVPPGVREAHHGFKAIDLHVPETPLVHAVIERTSVHADKPETVRVLTYVVAPHGTARRGDVPVFEPSRGSVAATAREPGAFEATWTLPPGPAGETRLVVRLPGSAASRVVLRVDAVAGAPATVAVAFDREALVAGEADLVKVHARALDAAGNAVAAPVTLEADAGELEGVSDDGAGAVSARLRVAPRFAGRHGVVVTARSKRDGIAGSRTLLLVPGPAAAVRVASAASAVLADGARDSAVRIAVVDRFENPIAAQPEVHAARGQVVGIDAAADGGWVVRYRPPAVSARGEDRIVAQAGDVSGSADLTLVPPRAGLALLASAGGFEDVRGRFGGAGARLAAELPADALPLGSAVALSWRAELDVLGADLDGAPARRRESAETIRLRGGALLAGAALEREVRGGSLFASATAGVLVARADPSDGAPRFGAAPAARLAIGAAMPLRRAAPFLEVSVLAAGPRPSGAFAAVGLSAGMIFDVGGVPWRRSSSSTTSR